MDDKILNDVVLGKRKLAEINMVKEAALKIQKKVETEVGQPSLADFNKLNDAALIEGAQDEKCSGPSSLNQPNLAMRPDDLVATKQEVSPLAGNEATFKFPFLRDYGKAVAKIEVGPLRRAAGRPPRPKHTVVQALVCEKKRKF